MSEKREVDFHNRLKLLRIERGLSRKQLADLVQVHPQTIGYIERGQFNPSIEVALKISDVLEVGLDAIFSRTPFATLSHHALTEGNVKIAVRERE